MVACLFFLLPRAQGRDDRLLVPRLALAFFLSAGGCCFFEVTRKAVNQNNACFVTDSLVSVKMISNLPSSLTSLSISSLFPTTLLYFREITTIVLILSRESTLQAKLLDKISCGRALSHFQQWQSLLLRNGALQTEVVDTTSTMANVISENSTLVRGKATLAATNRLDAAAIAIKRV